MSPLFDATSDLLTAMIRIASLRHQVLSRNVANIDTPGYRPQELSFSEEIRLASDTGDIPAVVVKATVANDPIASAGRYDGNTVDLDRQMAKMAENTLWHNTLIQILNSRMSLLRTAVRGG